MVVAQWLVTGDINPEVSAGDTYATEYPDISVSRTGYGECQGQRNQQWTDAFHSAHLTLNFSAVSERHL